MSSRPKDAQSSPARSPRNVRAIPESRLVVVSANDKTALESRIRSCISLMGSSSPERCADVAFTFAHGRRVFRHRAALVFPERDTQCEIDAIAAETQIVRGIADDSVARAIFMFPGQGSQFIGMGRQLYEQQPQFRESFRECEERLERILNFRLSDLLYSDSSSDLELRRDRLTQTSIAQPALFTIEYALGRLLEHYGVRPACVLGHSIGEFAAATLAGVFELEAALQLVAVRGQLMQSMPPGSMAAVSAKVEDVIDYCVDGLDIAAVNAPGSVVVSGPAKRVREFEKLIGQRGIDTRTLHTSHAFHSAMMDPIVEKFQRAVESASPRPPSLPIVSTMTGTWLKDSEAISSDYWAAHLRNTVRFADAVATARADQDGIFAEVGPGIALTSSVISQSTDAARPATVVATLGHPKANDPAFDAVLRCVGDLWVNGVDPDFDVLYDGASRRLVRLPTYSFTRSRYWVDPPTRSAADAQKSAAAIAVDFEEADAEGDSNSTDDSESLLSSEVAALLESRLGTKLQSTDFGKSFLQLGFDSLGLSQLAARIRQKLGVTIPVPRLFRDLGSPTSLIQHLLSEGAVAEVRKRPAPGPATSGSTADKQGAPRAGNAVSPANTLQHDVAQTLLTRMSRIESTLAELNEKIDGRLIAPPVDGEHTAATSESPDGALTQAQREIWVAAAIGGEAANLAYNECREFSFDGTIDIAALLDAVGDLPDRHESLRHRYAHDGQSLYVAAQANVPVEHHDLRHIEDAEASAMLQALRRKQVSTPFDLSDGPMLRGDLVRMRDDQSVLILCAHHIAVDGSSWEVLIRELAELYSARIENRQANLPDAGSFAEFSANESNYLGRSEFSQDEAYWLKQLRGYGGALMLPADTSRPSKRTLHSDRSDQLLSRDVMTQVRALAATLSCTPQTILFAAFQLLVHRLSRQSDFVIGMPTSGQAATGFEALVGNCVNVLPIRTIVTESSSVSSHIESLHNQLLDCLEHQRVSYTTLLPKLDLPRDSSRTPLIQVSFGMGRSQKRPQFSGVETRLDVVPRISETFELYVYVTEDAGSMQASWSYNTALFSADTIAQWQRCFECIIGKMVESPGDYTISDIPIMDDADRDRVIAMGIGPAASEDLLVPVHHRIHAQGTERPNDVALIHQDESLSFGELNVRANRISHWLQSRDIPKGSLVAVCLERTTDLVAMLLGIWRAGLGYVPLDPAYPTDRLQVILEDAGASLVIVSRALRERVPESFAPQCIDDVDFDAFPSSSLPLVCEPDSTAYVIFTSGSTGRPKGVQISQGALANFIFSMAEAPGFTSTDRLLAITTISFDISLLELFLPLYCGGTVVLASREQTTNPRALQKLIDTHEVTVMQATPATWQMLYDGGWTGSRQLKVLCGGEAFPRHLAERFLQTCGEIWNVYGPTETTVWSTAKRITDASALSIGRPIHNTSVFVLDSHNRPVPPGVSGELWIGGSGVADGYLGRPELTSERFVDVPGLDAGIIYRTGDLARLRNDGELECLGRVDFQVKIRGFRIELGEIESVLIADSRVAAAVVVAIEMSPGDKHLVGYVVAEPGVDADPTELRDSVSRKLPGYMVPSKICVLDSLPMTPNNKIDRKALPSPDAVTPSRPDAQHRVAAVRAMPLQAAAGPAPRNDIEAKVTAVFAGILGRSHVSPRDDFFEMGGHSLLAVRAINEINDAFASDFSVASIFEHPTGESLAKIIESEDVRLGDSVITLFDAGTNTLPFFFICGIALYQPLAANISRGFSSYGVYVRSESEFFDGGDEQDSASLRKLASEYADAIEAHPACAAGVCVLGGVSFGGLLAFEVARQLSERMEVRGLVILDTLLPFAKTRNYLKSLSFHVSRMREHGWEKAREKVLSKLSGNSHSKHSKGEVVEQMDNNARLWQTLNSPRTSVYLAERPTWSGNTIVVRARDANRPGFDVAADLGWSRFITGSMTVVDAPGDHLGLIRETATAQRILEFFES